MSFTEGSRFIFNLQEVELMSCRHVDMLDPGVEEAYFEVGRRELGKHFYG